MTATHQVQSSSLTEQLCPVNAKKPAQWMKWPFESDPRPQSGRFGAEPDGLRPDSPRNALHATIIANLGKPFGEPQLRDYLENVG